ncbi:ankyrin repeat-containing domain protein [Trichophaea hybrida]|nr:ankyrin repeat-containing domain protein [Trichophaea hybrida]
MSLLTVPTEILTIIAEGLPKPRDLNALVRTSRKLHLILNPGLYKLGISLPSNYGQISVLRWAVKASRISTINLLLENGQDIHEEFIDSHSISSNGPTALHAAVCDDDEPLVRFLLQHGANPGNVGEVYDNTTALHLAACHGHTAMIQILLEWGKGANIEMKDSNGYTPLIDAINRKYVKAVETLLEYGADANTTDQIGMSALHLAAISQAGNL